MKRMLYLLAALCLALCLIGSGDGMASGEMDEEQVEFEEIETTPIDEALGENLAELEDPEKTGH